MIANYQIDVEEKSMRNQKRFRGEVVLKYKIQYPQFKSCVFRRALDYINYYNERLAKDFASYSSNKLYTLAMDSYDMAQKEGYDFSPYETNQVFKVTYNQDCAISLYSDRVEYTGGAHGIILRTSQTWNLQTAKQVELESLFPGVHDYRYYILSSVNGEIARQIEAGQEVYFDDYEKNTAQYFDPEHYYLTPKGIIIYFENYEIAPFSSGIMEFCIPFVPCKIEPPFPEYR